MDRHRGNPIFRPALFLVLVLMPLAAACQTSGLSGTVKDAAGKPVAGAEVSAKNAATAQAAQASTDASGAYTLPALGAGNYDVTVTAKGFADKVSQVTLPAEGTQALSVTLTAAPPGQELPNAPSPPAQEPSLQDLGFSQSQTESNPQLQARLNKRTRMLKIHQTLGLITLAPMAADLITGPMAKVKGKNGQPIEMPTQGNLDMHAAFGSATAALYFSTAYFAMFAPKVPGVQKRGAIRMHEALAFVHMPGMILTPILGSMAFSQEQNGEKVHGIASAHGAVAAVTIVAYASSIVAVSWPIHLKFWEKK
ncbi:MAG: carboxypeptidase-like regulatory domain-containing protein [Acidobacteriota bacterium]